MKRSLACLTALTLSAGIAQAGWPFFSEDGLRRGTPEFYEARAALPPGQRQEYKYGKMWPLSPRPTGPKQPFIHKYHTAHYWPYPYVCEDRASVLAMCEMQTYNGWMAATTLYDFHFDPATHELNHAGKAHLRWILTATPEQFREAHVALPGSPEVNAARLAAVESEVAQLIGVDQGIPVLPIVADPVGRPAAEVQKIFSDALNNQMPPSITYTPAGTSGG
ncbi:MAG: hypothetical protein KDA80_01055 [Planctomycetaceae bacterium]|nr:hypothetical protein [Planctomycetaceae bacterium]